MNTDPPAAGRSRRSRVVALAFAAMFFGVVWMAMHAHASRPAGDEEVLFFPTSAYVAGDGDAWTVPVHGWVFERERDSLWRAELVNELMEKLELDPAALESRLFRRRAWLFLADNERGKHFEIRIGERRFPMSRSAPNGHFMGTARLARSEVQDAAAGGWLEYELVMAKGDGRRFRGRVQLVEPTGVSVISDIDDTIKITGVHDKRELLANTFLREFSAAPGMAAWYRRLAEAGDVFHYVSASPWQLYPALAGFLDRDGFPRGSFHLKLFRAKDRSFMSLLAAPEAYKIPVIESILSTYPGRKFILVGDSGEKDPEVYGAVARSHPGQVLRIFIRRVEAGGRDDPERFRIAFEGLPVSLWTVFTDPHDLPAERDPAQGSGKAGRFTREAQERGRVRGKVPGPGQTVSGPGNIIYAAGRAVTVAGGIEGKNAEPLGETDYTYPIREHHLWPCERQYEVP